MYLKELTLRGFKSFASATTLRFEPGITAVVGPNGSGKSNIVDALAWVMGEQGAKTLRGSSMEDVIFAGTSSRPPLGRAQVSLTIDNSDHALDIEYTEVTISRTIFRSGGSEYAINGTPVRLLDVQELLSDTGLGSQMHVIVGQGRLSTILHADPAGHRAIIEEAAGILKHRRRKERSLRKLKSTQDNLARIDDLLTEINRQLGPLRRQAKISRRADGIQVSLRDAKARLLADDVSQLEVKRSANRKRLGEVRTTLASQQRELARTKLRIEQLEQEASSNNPVITQLTETEHRFSQIDERYVSLGQVVEERARSLRSQDETRPVSDPALLEARAVELDAQVSTQSEATQKLSVAQEQATQSRAGKEAQLAGVRQTIGELRRTTKEREGNVARLQQLIARQEALLDSSAKRMADFETQKTSFSQQLEAVSGEIEELRQQSTTDETEQTDEIDAVKSRLDTAKDQLQKDLDTQRDVQNQKIRLDARAEALRDTVEQRQSRASLSSDKRLHALGGLASSIRVDEGWEESIATALSQFSSALVVEGSADLETALKIASETTTERTALIVPSTQDFTTAHDGSSPVWAAADLVHAAEGAPEASDKILASVRRLLEGVGVCQTWEEARTQADKWRLIVTQHGEIVTPVGVVTATNSAPSDLSLLARRQKALKESESLATQLSTLGESVDSARSLVAAQSEKLNHLNAARAERRIAAKQAATAVEMRVKQQEEYRHRLSGIDDSIASIRRDRAESEAKKKELGAALQQAQTSNDDSFSLEDFETKETDLEKQLAHMRDAEMAAKLAAAEARRKVDSLTRQAQMLHDDARHAAQQKQLAEERTRRRAAQLSQLTDISAKIASVRQLLSRCVTDVSQRRQAAQKQASVHDEELTRLRGVRNDLEPVVTKLVAEEHELDVARERYATQFGQLSQKVSDELGMQPEALVETYGPEQPVPELSEQGEPILKDQVESADTADTTEESDEDSFRDFDVTELDDLDRYRTVSYVRSEQEKRLKKAEADLARLGKVNPLATEEFDALQERHTYLNEQRNDVAKSRDDLMGIVKDLDVTMQRVFKEAFDDVSAAFEKIFAVLFPGGHGRLRLENENDLLNTGVLVEASPAGKKVRQLTLLSGGEKSLTALALLLAIFTARPSPFYVMDEVEAALDDLNLTRLLEALKQLREHAQLIIITHQQRTMALADALYGITMRSDGVTAVISQKVER